MVAIDSLKHSRIGLWTASLGALRAPQMLEVAAELDSLGYGSLWFGESYSGESLTTALALAGATAKLVIGTGIASIYARGAMATGAGSRTIEALAPGRFVLGLGVSHKPLVERDRHATYESPLPAMGKYLDELETAPYIGSDDTRPPIVLAALGDAMLALARARTAGAHPYLVTPDHTLHARGILGPEPLLVVEQAVVLNQDRQEGKRRAHEHLDIYTGLPNYRNSWLRQGFSESDLVRGGSDKLASSLVVIGDEAAILKKVQEHLDAGADHVCLQVLGENYAAAPVPEWRQMATALGPN